MIIVPVDNLKEGMVLEKDVASTSAREYKILLTKGTVLTKSAIAVLKDKGIKSVKIVGVGERADAPVAQAPSFPQDVPPAQIKTENEHIGRALTDLNSIFDTDSEIKELSKEAVRKVDTIADDIYNDLSNDSSYLATQMTALQNFDDYTYKHCLRVSMISASVCGELGLSGEDTKEVIVSALLHDIGKSNIDHEIIIKPGKLTDEEFEKIKQHPLIGYNILKRSGQYSDNVLSGVLFHQEKFDGSGYPTGISGKKIPLIARIMTVADVFDALTSNRPYRKPWSVAETEEYILGSCGTHFDYDVTVAFLRAFNPYPIGTVVSLSDGRHGVVIGRNTNVLRPVVHVIGHNKDEVVDMTSDFRYLSLMITGIYGGDYSLRQ